MKLELNFVVFCCFELPALLFQNIVCCHITPAHLLIKVMHPDKSEQFKNAFSLLILKELDAASHLTAPVNEQVSHSTVF